MTNPPKDQATPDTELGAQWNRLMQGWTAARTIHRAKARALDARQQRAEAGSEQDARLTRRREAYASAATMFERRLEAKASKSDQH